jgi:hypothetical protein
MPGHARTSQWFLSKNQAKNQIKNPSFNVQRSALIPETNKALHQFENKCKSDERVRTGLGKGWLNCAYCKLKTIHCVYCTVLAAKKW